jgi:hypothetical protein
MIYALFKNIYINLFLEKIDYHSNLYIHFLIYNSLSKFDKEILILFFALL